MRRYSFTERPRQSLIETLTEWIEGDSHMGDPKPERIEAYKRARTALEHGAVEVQAWAHRFRVIEAVRMPYNLNEGTRNEIVADLETSYRDQTQQGSGEKARVIARALHALEAGAIAVRAEGSLYRVVEG